MGLFSLNIDPVATSAPARLVFDCRVLARRPHGKAEFTGCGLSQDRIRPLPFHVAGLMILRSPANASWDYLRQLARKCDRLNELWPLFNKKLLNPENLADAAWVPADDYHPERHVFHYSLPQPGRMDDLLALVTRAHERPSTGRGRCGGACHRGFGAGKIRTVLQGPPFPGRRGGCHEDDTGPVQHKPGRKLNFDTAHPEFEKHAGHHSLFANLGI